MRVRAAWSSAPDESRSREGIRKQIGSVRAALECWGPTTFVHTGLAAVQGFLRACDRVASADRLKGGTMDWISTTLHVFAAKATRVDPRPQPAHEHLHAFVSGRRRRHDGFLQRS